ncbi:MAG TPA: polyprenyl synthetase family protein [Thermoanaerobaculia bacterium]|nr:polyprenyl synthetase family protein [Thermoanaerobaculia bacterium]
MTARPPEEAARPGWRSAREIGAVAERAATLEAEEVTVRASLRSEAQTRGVAAAQRDERFASIRANIAACAPCVFFDWTRDAARSFGNEDAARVMLAPIAAVIEGIRIIDDIQDEEVSCLATEVGIERALVLASGAFGIALELLAELPLHGDAWRAAAASLGRGLRETAIGQELESAAPAGFDAFWEVVDRKTPPLAATAVELGALAAGAAPEEAAALTSLAVPLGRLLQISDDCLDALADGASDWRTPRRNLLMAYALSGPNAVEIEALLARGDDADALHDAQLALLRDGALAYALHAQVSTLAELKHKIDSLVLPDPRPFLRGAELRRYDVELLLRECGVRAELASRLTVLD